MGNVTQTKHDQPHGIQTREEFIEFVKNLRCEIVNNPDSWENNTLPLYLEAICSWVEDMDGYYLNRGEVPPANVPWRVLGDILRAATLYE